MIISIVSIIVYNKVTIWFLTESFVSRNYQVDIILFSNKARSNSPIVLNCGRDRFCCHINILVLLVLCPETHSLFIRIQQEKPKNPWYKFNGYSLHSFIVCLLPLLVIKQMHDHSLNYIQNKYSGITVILIRSYGISNLCMGNASSIISCNDLYHLSMICRFPNGYLP